MTNPKSKNIIDDSLEALDKLIAELLKYYKEYSPKILPGDKKESEK